MKNNQLWIDYAEIFAHGYMNYVFLINTLYKYINTFESFFLDNIEIKIILIKKFISLILCIKCNFSKEIIIINKISNNLFDKT